MSNQLIINVTPQETNVALLEDGMLAELYIERTKGRSIVGNIYKGRVVKVLPGMQAAFVDIGLEKAAFLYVSDIYRDIEEYSLMLEEGSNEEGDFEFEVQGVPSQLSQPSQIEDLLCEGQEILVQVSKEPIGTKGTRITSHFTLPSRYLVLMPTVDHVGVSRRIKDHDERRRLMEIIQGIKPQGLGFIVRTASEGADQEVLNGDMDFLLKLWDNIQRRKESCSAPYLVHSDLNLVLRSIRDLLSTEVNKVVVDDQGEHGNISNFMKTYMPNLTCDVEIYEGREPIFSAYGIEMEIDKSLGRKVWLKSGGYIVIDMTEALTAIDVNTGRFVGKRNLEDTILKTNLEAAKEIAYQLRLRNIGGIIIIDFIDMERDGDREKVYLALEEALKKDRTKTNILKISELGLVEMTRKRTRESVPGILCEPCDFCDGSGYVKSKTTVCYDIFREIERTSSGLGGATVMVDVNPEVADLLYDEERMGIEHLERKLNKKIVIKAKDGLHQDQFEIVEV
jgi:ribonuclease G